MRIQRAVDDRLLLFVASLLVCAGCLVQPESKAKKPASATGISELTRLAQLEYLAASADAIDKVADRVESGELKYDSGLQQAMQEAFNVGLMGPQNQKLSKEMSKIISPGETFDPVKTGAALRATARGRRALK